MELSFRDLDSSTIAYSRLEKSIETGKDGCATISEFHVPQIQNWQA